MVYYRLGEENLENYERPDREHEEKLRFETPWKTENAREKNQKCSKG